MRRELQDHRVLSVVYPFAPTPASRPRISRWDSYYTGNYKKFRAEADQYLARLEDTIEGELFVISEFVCKRPKKPANNFPVGDNDNFEKAAWDALSRAPAGWVDDKYVIGNLSWKRFTLPHETPHTLLEIYAL